MITKSRSSKRLPGFYQLPPSIQSIQPVHPSTPLPPFPWGECYLRTKHLALLTDKTQILLDHPSKMKNKKVRVFEWAKYYGVDETGYRPSAGDDGGGEVWYPFRVVGLKGTLAGRHVLHVLHAYLHAYYD